MNIFTAWVAGRNGAGVRSGVPTVNGGIELQTRVGAFPSGFRHLAKELAGFNGFDYRAVGASGEAPVAVGFNGFHENIGYPHGVVGVLKLHRMNVFAVQAHVKACGLQGFHLVFFFGFAPNELFNVGVFGIQNNHFGGPTGFASTFYGASRSIGAPHKADRSAGFSPTFEKFS